MSDNGELDDAIENIALKYCHPEDSNFSKYLNVANDGFLAGYSAGEQSPRVKKIEEENERLKDNLALWSALPAATLDLSDKTKKLVVALEWFRGQRVNGPLGPIWPADEALAAFSQPPTKAEPGE
jgi:hypothetical protein